LLPPLPFSDEEVIESHPAHSVEIPPLGQGSFKVAYRVAVENETRVLKIIYSHSISVDPEDFDMDSIPERIGREIEGMSAVDCPYIVTLLSPPTLRTIGASNYLCFEEPYYPGGTLEDRLKSGPLSSQEVRTLTIALLEASAALWNSKKIVHRDIKPGNITFDDADTPILLDLGLALFTEMSAITGSGDLSPATPRYAAPEQFEFRRNAKIDFRTDQYLIALTAVEAALGHHLFWHPGITTMDYLESLDAFEANDLASIPLDDDLRKVLTQMLAPQLYARFRTPELPLQRLGVL
jgi:serine/threonine protein kinase